MTHWLNLTALLLAPALASPAPQTPSDSGLVLHEWGTFTAIAGADGKAVTWRPLVGPSDLPSFVYDLEDSPLESFRTIRGPTKGSITAQVRMETPVIYFYTEKPMDVSLSVTFNGGTITEWYPHALYNADSTLNWGRFHIDPDLEAPLPLEPAPSHYYPARAVNSAMIRACEDGETEYERFLFYRGVGDFALSLNATLDEQGLRLWPNGRTLGKAIVFENRDGTVGVDVADVDGDGVRVSRPHRDDDVQDVMSALRTELRGAGLYADEVEAMLKTWEDHWFEPGLRVFYLLPESETTEILPLAVDPQPASQVRVIVGRVEVFTPEDLSEAEDFVTQLPEEEAKAAMTGRFGRLAEPLLKRLSEEQPALEPQVTAILASR